MDPFYPNLPFYLRLVFCISEGAAVATICHFFLLILAQHAGPHGCEWCPQLVEFKFNSPLFFSLALIWFLYKFDYDPEMTSTWKRYFICLLITIYCATQIYTLPQDYMHKEFSNVLKDQGIGMWLFFVLTAVLVFHIVNVITKAFDNLMERAQRRFPNIERGRLQQVVFRAFWGSDPYNFIDNYQFAADRA